jgi:hypothetical protein
MYGDFAIDRVTGRQVGHQMLLVQWYRGNKVIIVPESHDDSGSLDVPSGVHLLLAGVDMLRLTRRGDWPESFSDDEADDLDTDKNEPNHD